MGTVKHLQEVTDMWYRMIVLLTVVTLTIINNEAWGNNVKGENQTVGKEKDSLDKDNAANATVEPKEDDELSMLTKQEVQDIFVRELTYETSRKRLQFTYPAWYDEIGMGETYVLSEEWYHFERDVRKDILDSAKHAGIEFLWSTPAGQWIDGLGDRLKLRFFTRHEKEGDFESENRIKYGFLFGEDGERRVQFGAELGDKPKFLMEWKTGKIEHQVSYKSDLLAIEDEGRIRYRLKNINGWFSLATEYDFSNGNARFYFDDLTVAPNWYLSSGFTYHGEDQFIGSRLDRSEAPEGSVTWAVSAHGSFSDIRDLFRPFNPSNWKSPRKMIEREQRYLARKERARIMYASQ